MNLWTHPTFVKYFFLRRIFTETRPCHTELYATVSSEHDACSAVT
jgi:hypothetical protein